MTTLLFAGASDEILYYAGKHPDGLIQKWDAGDVEKEWIQAGGHNLDGQHYLDAFKKLRASGLITHDVGHDYVLTERGKKAAATVQPL